MKLNLKTLLIGGALLLFVFVIGPRFFGGGDAPPAQEPPVAQVQPEPTLPDGPGAAVEPEPTVALAESIAHGQAAAAHRGCGCTAAVRGAPTARVRSVLGIGPDVDVMLYQDADDKILEQDIYVDLNEAERVGSSDRVQHRGPDGSLPGPATRATGTGLAAKRFYVTQDNDLNRVQLAGGGRPGRVNMSDPQHPG